MIKVSMQEVMPKQSLKSDAPKADEGFSAELDKASGQTEEPKDVVSTEPKTEDVKDVENVEDSVPDEVVAETPETEEPKADSQAEAVEIPVLAIPVILTDNDVAPPESNPSIGAISQEPTPEQNGSVVNMVENEIPQPEAKQPAVEATTKNQIGVVAEQSEETQTTVAKEAEPFAKLVMEEADKLLKQQQDVKTNPADAEIVKPQETKVAAQQEAPQADAGNGGKSEQQKTDEKPVIQTQNPMTATISQDGKVEFRESNIQPMPQQIEQKESVFAKLIEQVQSTVTKEKTEFFLQLKPEHLGGLSILLSAEEKGIAAKLMTSSKDVQAIIQSDMSAMQEALREKGINVVQMEVIYDQMASSTSKGDTGNGQQWRGSTGNNHGGVPESIENATALYDNLSYYDVLAEQGGSVEFSA